MNIIRTLHILKKWIVELDSLALAPITARCVGHKLHLDLFIVGSKVTGQVKRQGTVILAKKA